MNMKRELVFLPALYAACLVPSTSDAKEPSGDRERNKPNVIVILADDLGYGDLQCYGARNVLTPNVDRLAEFGIRFTNAHAVASTSTPSRYSLLTGMYSWRRSDTDIARGDAAMIIRPGQYSMADMFKSCGYATCAIGKWHLGLGDVGGRQDWNAPLPSALGDIGFDYSYIMAATADRVPCVFIENGKVANYDPAAPIYVSYEKNFDGEPTGASNPELLYNLKHSHGHDMSIVNGIGRIGFMKGGGKALWKDENIADSITVHAVDFIKSHKDEPFFMYYATNDVHVPRFPHERFRGQSGMGLRGDAIVQFDWCVGELMRALEEQGIADNTLVILTSDNGPVVDDGYDDRAEELLNGHCPAGPWRGGKYSAFEGGTAVPFIVSWPGAIEGKRESDALLSHIDLFASFASLTGAVIPKGNATDSQNHLGAILGEKLEGREYIIEQSNNRVLSVRTKDWKYIEPNDGDRMIPWGPKIETGNDSVPQLYDMKRSSGERKNVADRHTDVLFKLMNYLRNERNK